MQVRFSRVAMLAAVVGLMLTPVVAQEVPPTIDDQTSGAWIGTYGECAYVLGAYDNPWSHCETAIVPGTGVVPPECQNYYPEYGGSQDVLDCEYDALDLDGNGDQDMFYEVYTGCSTKVLRNPDESYSGQNSLWFGGCASSSGFDYTLNGVPAGTYRLAVYVYDDDSNGARDQTIQVCIGGDCSGADAVGNHEDGVYQLYDVDVAGGESITVYHTRTAGANAVAQGVFFDPTAGPLTCVNGKACSTTLQDTTTEGNWTGTYGSAGYVLFNRPVATKGVCQDPSPTYQAGNFGGAVTVTTNNAKSWFWGTPTDSYHCGFAAAWIWSCDDVSGRALENPGECGGVGQCAGGYTTAGTWDDTGELQNNGPDLMVDVVVDLPGVWELSFYAVDYDTNDREEVFHLYELHSQVPVAAPVDIGTYRDGKYVTYTLTGPFAVTLRVEKTAGANAIISGIFVDPAEGYDCHGEPPPPDCEGFCTYTMGGWGAPYHGANPGTIRDDNWETVYGEGGSLVIDGSAPQCKTITFTDGPAVEAYLPCGGRPRATNKNHDDPTCPRKGNAPEKNTFMSQVIALRLNVDYSCAGVIGDPESGYCLGDLVILSGPFAGETVYEFLAQAEDALLCGFFAEGLDAPDYNWTATAINENFDGCEENNGFLDCGEPSGGGECGLFVTKSVATSEPAPVDRDGDGMGPDVYPGEEVTFTLNVETGEADMSSVVLTDVLPSFTLAGVDYDYYFVDETSCTFTPNYGQTCSYNDATNTMTVNLGNIAADSNVTITYEAHVNLLAPPGTEAVNTATVTGSDGVGICSDDDSASVWIVPGTPQYPTDDIGTPGYVCNHIQGTGNPFEDAEVNIWALNIEASSRWWAEFGGDLYDPSEPPTFHNIKGIVCANQNQGSDKDKLERHLLTLWFNVADFRVATNVQLKDICGAPEWPAGYKNYTVGDVITAAEQALLDGDSANYLFWKDICDGINNGVAPPCGP